VQKEEFVGGERLSTVCCGKKDIKSNLLKRKSMFQKNKNLFVY